MDTLEYQASKLIDKIKHYLVTAIDRTLESATVHEFYQAFCYALKEEMMVNWAACRRSFLEHSKRTIYYLSMEYLPGRILANNIINLHDNDLVRLVLKKLNRDFHELISCEHDPGLGNGGLGRLVSCLLDSLATKQYPAMGYGLRYQYGIFEQEIWDGVQIERPDCWLLLENPWEIRRDSWANIVKFCGTVSKDFNKFGEEILQLHDYEEVRALPFDIPIVGYSNEPNFSVVTLRLWSTKESPRNFELQRYNAGRLDQAAENMTLTDVLYPVDVHETGKRIRLKQEFLLVSASLQDIIHRYLALHQNLNDFADRVRIQINDTHPALAVPELIRILMTHHNIPWKKAFEMTQECLGFTNHTVLQEALEEWDQSLFRYLLPRQYAIVERLNHEFCELVRKKFPNDEDRIRRMSILENGRVRMAHLSIYGSHKINGVAALHTEILKDHVFKDFYELYPERFVNVTNGVTQRRWLLTANPDLSEFITKRIGPNWITNFSDIRNLSKFANDEQSQKELLAIKKCNKERLIQFLHANNPKRDQRGRPSKDPVTLHVDSLFDVQIKRFHEYKRQLLNALHVIMLYHELLENPASRKVKRTVIFAGKAAAGYEAAKNIIRLIHCLARKINFDPAIHERLKVVFVENYGISKAQMIIPAADLSEQISTAGLEASGTGNMKLSMNGALTIGTDDGANIEMRQHVTDRWWPFLFGASAQEIDALRKGNLYNAWDVYSSHEKIRQAVDALRDHSLVVNEHEHEALSKLYETLLEGRFGSPPDRFFVLKDLPAYYETQKRVEELYSNPALWAEYVIHNIAGMHFFSTDRSIHDYAERVWEMAPCPLDLDLLKQVRDEYAEHVPSFSP